MSFKTIDRSTDVANLVSAINEVIAVSGSIYSTEANIKKYENISSGTAAYQLGGYFQTVYDASPTSSLSTPLFDVTYGYSTGSDRRAAATSTSSLDEKTKIYRHFASTLLGNVDSTFTIASTSKQEAFFLLFKRNIQKDELSKGTVKLTINTDLDVHGVAQFTASDEGATTAFKQGPGGEYAPLYISGSAGSEVGQVWYQAGVVVLPPDLVWGNTVTLWSGSETLYNEQASGSINGLCDGLRNHIERVDTQNQTNLHSSIYFLRAYNSEFNYSSNPTFIDNEQRIRVTSGSNILQTRTYITTAGLYDSQDNLVAVAKVNKPIMKSPDTEAVFRIRLDF